MAIIEKDFYVQPRFLIAALAALTLSTAALADAGHSHGDDRAYGEPGDPKKPARTIQITMREADGKMVFIPNKIDIRKGEQVKFAIRNNGELDHEIVVGTLDENLKHMAEMMKNPDMEHDDPNAKRLAPKKTGDIVWKFTKAGEFDFSCLIPGHREAGMSGTIIVK
ncbi:putative cupredoxin-like copper-binding protein [Xanthobacter flavus]|uniref:Copper oxidase n=2 Tax=Hyphomicrobiales TaxID=356 RepID=A0A9W6CP32_XANFL|nr:MULTISPECIES: cupredoxin family protein [Hyphomicrobiales]MBB5753702.1 putative cupredoxin-like copper-binding protein [Prosthecomicrobium pneumaticum]MDR6335188.1 putative cupredoxin-like copper-binding protein [Xanthobacter flavus]GLI23586.1 copper oxidase [Xanthobacter flavus]